MSGFQQASNAYEKPSRTERALGRATGWAVLLPLYESIHSPDEWADLSPGERLDFQRDAEPWLRALLALPVEVRMAAMGMEPIFASLDPANQADERPMAWEEAE